jgi:hypothetical protein
VSDDLARAAKHLGASRRNVSPSAAGWSRDPRRQHVEPEDTTMDKRPSSSSNARTWATTIIVHVVAVYMIVVPFAFDWNETHVFNPGWTGHAKFHLGHTILMSVLSSLGAIYLFWRGKDRSAAVLLLLVFWMAQAGAILFPGATFIDPEFVDDMPVILGVRLNQLMIDTVLVGVLSLAGYLSRGRKSPASPARGLPAGAAAAAR